MSNRIAIRCSRKRIKSIICASRGVNPEAQAFDRAAEPERIVQEWECITDKDVDSYLNFASIFLYRTPFRIDLVETEEEEPSRIVRVR